MVVIAIKNNMYYVEPTLVKCNDHSNFVYKKNFAIIFLLCIDEKG